VLLRPKNLDPQIVIDLDLNLITDLVPVSTTKGTYDLINDLLQANRTSTDLEVLRLKAID
jgi:hypothetical protein